MKFEAGKPRPANAGRKKGTPNKRTLEALELFQKYDCNPLEFMVLCIKGDLPCNVCRGKLKTKYRGDDGKLHERTCESCYGTGYEKLSPDARLKAATESAQYVWPKRKAIEHTVDVSDKLAEMIARGRERARKKE